MLPQTIKTIFSEIESAGRAKKKVRPLRRPSIGQLKLWLHVNKGHRLHHACEDRGTATKNTRLNPLNIRASKANRPPSRFPKLRAFKREFGII